MDDETSPLPFPQPRKRTQYDWGMFAVKLLPRHEGELANMEFVTAMAGLNRENPELHRSVDHDYYAVFLDLPEEKLKLIIQALIRGLNPMFLALLELKEIDGEEFAIKLLKAATALVALGYIMFVGENDDVAFCYPSGPKPSAAMEQAIGWRLGSLERLLREQMQSQADRNQASDRFSAD